MSKLIDLTGMRFGRLTVIERAENKGKDRHACWKCHCDCGNETVVRGDLLKSGATQSCGCLRKEKLSTHCMTHSSIYNTWQLIKNRCFNTNCKDYKYYGGRGITVYPEWIDNIQAFYDYVSQLEHFGEEGYSLDRINNDGNYEPNNLRWADKKTQGRNKRNNNMVEYNGVKMPLSKASELSGIAESTLRGRLQRGDRGDKIFRPVRKKH